MKYLFLAYGDEEQWAVLSTSERTTFDKAWLTYDLALQESGYLLASAHLQSDNSVTTVRVHKGELSLTDGPISPTKQQLVGFYLINARDLNEAVRLAAKMPQAQRGPIEIRPASALIESP